MSIKDIGELKREIVNLKEINYELFQRNVQPVIKVMTEKFLAAFEDYFSERGFVIRKKNDSVRASYDTLHFKAFSNDHHDIFIMKGKEQIASITVLYNGASKLVGYLDSRNFLDESIVLLEKGIENEKSLTRYLEKPVFYYTGSEFGHQYDSPLSVLDSIFHA